jgi:hypothetical protein
MFKFGKLFNYYFYERVTFIQRVFKKKLRQAKSDPNFWLIIINDQLLLMIIDGKANRSSDVARNQVFAYLQRKILNYPVSKYFLNYF